MSSSSSSSTAGRWIEASFEDFPPSLARVPKSVERYLYGAGEKHLLDMKIEMSRTIGGGGGIDFKIFFHYLFDATFFLSFQNCRSRR